MITIESYQRKTNKKKINRRRKKSDRKTWFLICIKHRTFVCISIENNCFHFVIFFFSVDFSASSSSALFFSPTFQNVFAVNIHVWMSPLLLHHCMHVCLKSDKDKLQINFENIYHVRYANKQLDRYCSQKKNSLKRKIYTTINNQTLYSICFSAPKYLCDTNFYLCYFKNSFFFHIHCLGILFYFFCVFGGFFFSV